MAPEKEILLILSTVNGFGYKKYQSLKRYIGLAELRDATQKELEAIPGIGRKLSEQIKRAIDNGSEELLLKLKRNQIHFITIEDENYPEKLKEIESPPLVIFTNKALPEQTLSIAIVGTRKPTPYGRTIARKFAMELASRNINIVSGLALGIDAEAHRGALEANGETTAVIGTGLDTIYPPENKKLWEKIFQEGYIISEFPPGTLPLAHNFPRRNRIIAGLSEAVLVVEAPIKSGALITANFALESGRDVMAIPGPIYSEASKGTNTLIKEGAIPVTSVEDILEALSYKTTLPVQSHKRAKHQKREDKESRYTEYEDILKLLESPLHIETISEKLNSPVNEVLTLLTKLKIKGLVEQKPGGYFVRSP